jgi:transposase InsO family protein
MNKQSSPRVDIWGQFRFAVIGGLLAAPPPRGELQAAIRKLAQREYQHPVTQNPVKFGFSTIERWYYQAVRAERPVAALERKSRVDSGRPRVMSAELMTHLARQYKRYPYWSHKLHSDNLSSLVREQPELGPAPSYSTVRRWMVKKGWRKKRRAKTPGQAQAARRLEKAEVRGYEAEYVHALWHLDFHHGSVRVLDERGAWHTPIALCILDDYSRLCCHIQWYLQETAEILQHGMAQAFHKRGLPRSLMTDNGPAMIAGETRGGLLFLGVQHEKTLPYSPYQNGKQEAFWGTLEGRLLAMLREIDLDLNKLNYLTQAWVEMEYNRAIHEETGTSPIERAIEGTSVGRPSPGSEEMNFAFTLCEHRIQRRSDGTITIKGVRFEVPARFAHMRNLQVRYRSWDLSQAWLVAGRDVLAVIRPQDKVKNASGERRALSETQAEQNAPPESEAPGYPPLLREVLADYAATGMPAAFIPKEK